MRGFVRSGAQGGRKQDALRIIQPVRGLTYRLPGLSVALPPSNYDVGPNQGKASVLGQLPRPCWVLFDDVTAWRCRATCALSRWPPGRARTSDLSDAGGASWRGSGTLSEGFGRYTGEGMKVQLRAAVEFILRHVPFARGAYYQRDRLRTRVDTLEALLAQPQVSARPA